MQDLLFDLERFLRLLLMGGELPSAFAELAQYFVDEIEAILEKDDE